MDLEKIRRMQNPKEYFSKRSETLGSLNTEVLLLEERIASELTRNSGKMIYQFPCNILYCYDTRDILSYRNGTELDAGLFQIHDVSIVYEESMKDELTANQLINVVFKAHILDPYDNDEKGLPRIHREDCVRATGELKNIEFNEDQLLRILLGKNEDIFIVKSESFELIKDFIESVKKELK